MNRDFLRRSAITILTALAVVVIFFVVEQPKLTTTGIVILIVCVILGTTIGIWMGYKRLHK